MDVRQLRYFTKIVELGSIRKASVELCIAQPALTHQMQRLEEEVNATLFNRHPRGVSLTDAGRLLLRKAILILEEVDRTVDELRAQSNVPSGRVSLAMQTVAARVLLPAVVDAFHALYPDVCLTVREGYSGFIYQWLAEGTVDLAICARIESRLNFEAIPLYREQMYLVGAGRKPVKGNKISITQVAGLKHIVATELHEGRRAIHRAISAAGGTLNANIEVDSFETMKHLVMAGFGYAIIPRIGCRQEIQEGKLWALGITQSDLTRDFLLVQTRARSASFAVRELQRILMQEVAKIEAPGDWEIIRPRSSNLL